MSGFESKWVDNFIDQYNAHASEKNAGGVVKFTNIQDDTFKPSDENASLWFTHVEENIFQTIRDVCEEYKLDVYPRVAGGWVRDKLLGRASDDVDIALENMQGEEFAMLLKEYLGKKLDGKIGSVNVIKSNPSQSKHLNTATFVLFGQSIDMNNLRTEIYHNDSRIPIVQLGSVRDDVVRRDFTMNSMYYNIVKDRVEDVCGTGVKDLRRGVLRTPLPAFKTFNDDPLRVLRGARFSGRFNFRVTKEIELAAAHHSVHRNQVRKISRERMGKELKKAFEEFGNVPIALAYICRWGQRPIVFSTPLPVVTAKGQVVSSVTVDPEQQALYPLYKHTEVASRTAVACLDSTSQDKVVRCGLETQLVGIEPVTVTEGNLAEDAVLTSLCWTILHEAHELMLKAYPHRFVSTKHISKAEALAEERGERLAEETDVIEMKRREVEAAQVARLSSAIGVPLEVLNNVPHVVGEDEVGIFIRQVLTNMSDHTNTDTIECVKVSMQTDVFPGFEVLDKLEGKHSNTSTNTKNANHTKNDICAHALFHSSKVQTSPNGKVCPVDDFSLSYVASLSSENSITGLFGGVGEVHDLRALTIPALVHNKTSRNPLTQPCPLHSNDYTAYGTACTLPNAIQPAHAPSTSVFTKAMIAAFLCPFFGLRVAAGKRFRTLCNFIILESIKLSSKDAQDVDIILLAVHRILRLSMMYKDIQARLEHCKISQGIVHSYKDVSVSIHAIVKEEDRMVISQFLTELGCLVAEAGEFLSVSLVLAEAVHITMRSPLDHIAPPAKKRVASVHNAIHANAPKQAITSPIHDESLEGGMRKANTRNSVRSFFKSHPEFQKTGEDPNMSDSEPEDALLLTSPLPHVSHVNNHVMDDEDHDILTSACSRALIPPPSVTPTSTPHFQTIQACQAAVPNIAKNVQYGPTLYSYYNIPESIPMHATLFDTIAALPICPTDARVPSNCVLAHDVITSLAELTVTPGSVAKLSQNTAKIVSGVEITQEFGVKGVIIGKLTEAVTLYRYMLPQLTKDDARKYISGLLDGTIPATCVSGLAQEISKIKK